MPPRGWPPSTFSCSRRSMKVCRWRVLEAMAAGLPAVVSDADGVREAIVDRRCGRLLAPNDRDSWLAAIIELIENSELRQMGPGGSPAAPTMLQPGNDGKRNHQGISPLDCGIQLRMSTASAEKAPSAFVKPSAKPIDVLHVIPVHASAGGWPANCCRSTLRTACGPRL